jgi:multimeric flavodoxin WrbA
VIRILGVSGSPIKGGNTEAFLDKALKFAASSGDVSTQMVSLAENRISDCIHCNWCVAKQKEGNPCAQQDAMREIYPLVLEADALLLASPVYVARLSGPMAAFLDRLRAFAHGNHYKGRLTDKVGGALGIGWFRHGGLETTLLSIAYGFMTYEMIPVGTGLGSPWGAPALASRGGTGDFERDVRLGVLEDEFADRSLKLLVKRVLSVTKKVSSGQGEG